jgi:hypothetical protein
MITQINYKFIGLLLAFFIVSLTPPAYTSTSDSFIKGYITAVLVREFNVSSSSFRIEAGVVTLNPEDFNDKDLAEVISIILGVDGVKRVEIAGDEARKDDARAVSDQPEKGEHLTQVQAQLPDHTAKEQKDKRLFDPLFADPRWPHFSVTYQFYTDQADFDSLVAASIGDTLPFYEDYSPHIGQWQVAAQAAAFTINDLDTSSWDLLNADFRFGLALLNRKNDFSSIARIVHFSTHAGDEFIINSQVDRLELSYEALDYIASYDLKDWLRVYGGGAYRFARHPKDFDPISVQYGAELKCTKKYINLRPVLGINFNNKQENDWHTELSVRTGVEIERSKNVQHKIQFLVSYFNGPSPYGQFFYQSHEYFDFGVHFHF